MNSTRRDSGHYYDAVVIGAGPNGLVAAIEIARAGRSVLVLEAAATPGGGTRTEELTLPGHCHDVCSTVHPLALASPALRDLPLAEHGVRWVHPDIPLAHPLDGDAATLRRDLAATAAERGVDEERWRHLFDTIAEPGSDVVDSLLDPIALPRHPVALARFGVRGVRSAQAIADGFAEPGSAALFAGLAAHSILPLDRSPTAGFGLLLGGLAHTVGWPFVEGGSQALADALVSILRSYGGKVECARPVRSLGDIPPSRVVLADLTPSQMLQIVGNVAPSRYVRRAAKFRHGPGIFKVDWVLDGPVPWTDEIVHTAGTVHVGGSASEIERAEADVGAGRHPDRPFVLVVQPSRFDPTRAPAGSHTLWGYCHVPHGSTVDMTARIESQIERFAPGFADRIVARHSMDTSAVEAHGRNYIGGDINGGAADLRQYVFRPVVAARPWITPITGWYLCSSSIPPGGGVHGMCGRKAARSALRRELR